MAIVKDTILVATATLCVGSALMEIPSESKSFNKFFPYIGTFLSAGIGYYFLRRKGYIKAAEYQPSQDMDDYSLNEIAKSSAIEGFEPMKFSVVGNRAEGLETIFDAEGSFGDKPSINLSWKSYEDANEENRDKIALFGYLRDSRVLATPANDSIKDKINIDFDVAYPKVDMNYTKMDLRGYFDFNGGRFYLIKYDFYEAKNKVKKGQPNFLIKPSYLVLYSKNGIGGEKLFPFTMVSGASRRLSKGQLEMVQPMFGDRNSKKAQYQKIITSLKIQHLGFLTGRKQATSEALQYLYFNCLTPELELDFDETLEVASNEFGIEKFQNMIIPYTYKVKDTDKKTRKITNYYYVDEYGDCKFFIAICINEEGTLRFLGDTKGRYGTSKRISNHGVVHSVTEIFEYRPILKYWLKSVVMDSANLSSRRINMWNNDRDKWLKQQYMPMLMSKWLPVLFSRHKSRTALDYIRFMKSCLASSELLKEESPATHQILTDNPNDLDDNVALELFKKYYSSKKNWEELAISWNSKGNDETKRNHTQFYNNITSYATNQLMRNNGDFSYELPITNIYSILDTNDTKNTIVPIASWFRSGGPNVLPLEINNTKDLKVRAFRKIYNMYKIEITDWITLEKMSYYTDETVLTPPSTDNYDPKDMTIEYDPYETLRNMINDPMNWPNNPFVKYPKEFKGYYDSSEMEAETFESESNKKPHSVTISRSSNSEKKLMAVFEDSEGKKIKTTHFGQRGASDYTKHGDKERMQRYLERHGGGTTTSTKEDWKDPTTAGALSRWILWNKPSLSASFSDYKSRFGLKGTLNVSKSAEERKCKSCGKPATTVVQEGSFCYECLPINLGAEYENKYGEGKNPYFYMEEFEQHYEDFLKKGKNTLRNRLSIYPHQKWVTTKKDLAKAVAISKLTENDLVSDETIIELYVNNFTKRQLFILNDLHYSLYSKKTKVGLAQQLIDKIRKPAWNYNDWKRIYGSESSEKDEASILVKALNDAGYEALFVGGVVRDMLMGLEPKDYDLGTSATPEEVANVVNGLEGYKYKFGPEGERAKRALTSLVKPPVGEVIEVTTFRKEMYGKDRSDIDAIPAKTFKEDAARRDLTINSMGMDLDGNIIDYFGGEKDITHRLVKTVGNPDERFREDPLRMIRAIRFAVKYKFALDDATWESIKRNHELVNDLSSKRRRDEIGKVLYYPNGFTLLMESGILPTLMPEFRNMKDYHHKLDYHPEGTLYNHYIEAFNKFTTIPHRTELGGWALLFHDIAKPQTAVWNEEGKYHTFYGHDKQGGQIVLENYNNTNGPFEFSKKELQKIAWTTDNHLGKFWEMKKPMKVAAMRNNENFPLLVQVVTGDTMGIRRGGDEELQARLEEIDKITAEINEKKEKAGNRPSGFAPKVIKELGLRGKEISETLSKIEEMVSTGVVNSYDEALGVLKSKMPKE